MDNPHIIVIRDFVKFAYGVDKVKSVEHLYRFVSKPKTLSEDVQRSIKEEARKCFSEVDWNDLQSSDRFSYKTGWVGLKRLKEKCNDEDLEDFNDFVQAFKVLYRDEDESVNKLLKELDLDPNSPEAGFLKRVFNELGEDFMDFVKSHEGGQEFDLTKLLTKGTAIYKSGKLNGLMTEFQNSNVRMSRILFSVGKLLEKAENDNKDDNKDKDGDASSSDEHELLENVA